ncbi:MAG: ABC transporter substrate-binding protein [Anaerolineales bacterium]
MFKDNLSKLFALLAVVSLVLVACGPAAAPATEAPVEEPVEEEPVDEPDFTGSILDAGSCDYGGKVLSIEAVDRLTVVFNLCRPDPAFEAKIAFTPFGIQPAEWIAENGGTGALLEHPVGTGPYMVTEWVRGEQLVYTRFDDYWGEPAPAQTAVLRWLSEGAARLQELQAGTADYVTSISPADIATVEGDANLQLIGQDNPNVLYIGFTNTFAPFDNVMVRQAIAMGIDRQRIVDNFYPAGSEVASHFTPCSITNGCEGDAWYDFDPEAARALLAEAGFPDGFETSIFYRDASRPYILEPGRVAVEIQTQLEENLGITAEVVVMESGEFIDQSTSGLLDGIHLLGWGADYPHVTNFLDFHFGEANPQFGTAHPEIFEPLLEASSIADPATAAPLYAEANNAIRELVPMVPVAHGAVLHAASASLGGAYYPPYGAPQLYKMDPGDDDLVYIQNAEPISLFCADETDGESLTACQQVVETLLEYADDSGDTVAELATECTANEDSTVWTCTLRDGVLFHDGSALDSNDVVASFAVGLDASSPYHVGNTGSFDYPAYLWDGFMNAPAE